MLQWHFPRSGPPGIGPAMHDAGLAWGLEPHPYQTSESVQPAEEV